MVAREIRVTAYGLMIIICAYSSAESEGLIGELRVFNSKELAEQAKNFNSYIIEKKLVDGAIVRNSRPPSGWEISEPPTKLDEIYSQSEDEVDIDAVTLPVPWAEVEVCGIGTGDSCYATVTGSDGAFFVPNIPPGNYTVRTKSGDSVITGEIEFEEATGNNYMIVSE